MAKIWQKYNKNMIKNMATIVKYSKNMAGQFMANLQQKYDRNLSKIWLIYGQIMV